MELWRVKSRFISSSRLTKADVYALSNSLTKVEIPEKLTVTKTTAADVSNLGKISISMPKNDSPVIYFANISLCYLYLNKEICSTVFGDRNSVNIYGITGISENEIQTMTPQLKEYNYRKKIFISALREIFLNNNGFVGYMGTISPSGPNDVINPRYMTSANGISMNENRGGYCDTVYTWLIYPYIVDAFLDQSDFDFFSEYNALVNKEINSELKTTAKLGDEVFYVAPGTPEGKTEHRDMFLTYYNDSDVVWTYSLPSIISRINM